MLAVSNGRHIVMSTPFGKRGHFWKIWDTERDLWEWFEIPAEMCPRISPEFLAEEKRTNPWFEQEYHCTFSAIEGAVFDDETIKKLFDSDIDPLWPELEMDAGSTSPSWAQRMLDSNVKPLEEIEYGN
jgi:hypothetical protein